MKTEYQVRFHTISPTEWITDVDLLRKSARPISTARLWRRQTETTEEAAVRRMAALDKWHKGPSIGFCREVETMSEFADRLSPPPAATETQVDWDTLEPVKEVPVWQSRWGYIWYAGITKDDLHKLTNGEAFAKVTGEGKDPPIFAIGHTRESALRNLAELQSVRK